MPWPDHLRKIHINAIWLQWTGFKFDAKKNKINIKKKKKKKELKSGFNQVFIEFAWYFDGLQINGFWQRQYQSRNLFLFF